jgi:hypothetical protein
MCVCVWGGGGWPRLERWKTFDSVHGITQGLLQQSVLSAALFCLQTLFYFLSPPSVNTDLNYVHDTPFSHKIQAPLLKRLNEAKS